MHLIKKFLLQKTNNFWWFNKIIIGILCAHINIVPVQSQGVLLTGKFTIGGASTDAAFSMVQTIDTGFVFAGYTNSFGAGNVDLYVVKMDKLGTLEWSRTIGGSGNDYGRSIIQTLDSGYAVTGYTTSFGAGGNDVYVVKLDKIGTIVWTRTIGGGFGNEFGYSIKQTVDGGYIVTGSTFSYQPVGGAFTDNMYVVKLDNNGALQWTLVIGGNGSDYGYSVIQTIDGGYIIVGNTNTAAFVAGGYDVYMVKLDNTGTLQWTKTIGGNGSDYGYSIIQTTDGGYALTGNTSSYGAGGGVEFYIIKVDDIGNVQWTKTVGTAYQDFASSIVQTMDGGYVIAGYTGVGLLYNFALIRLNNNGSLRWAKSYDIGGYAQALSVVQTKEGGFAMAGYTDLGGNYEIYMIKTDSSGNVGACPTNPITSLGSGGMTGSGGSSTTGGLADVGGIPNSGGSINSQQCILLPIELVDFSANYDYNIQSVVCKWTTASEINNNYFVLERSTDGIVFNPVSKIFGSGNSSTYHFYSYADKNPPIGLSYYRLKQVDFDGKYSYSTSRIVHIESLETLTVFPNPVVNQFTFVFQTETDVSVEIKIFDAIGNEVLNRETFFNEGKNEHLISVDQFPSGFYMLQVITDHSVFHKKYFLIQ